MATQSVKARRPFPYQGRRIAAGDVVHHVPTRDARSLIQRGLASAHVVEPTATPSATSSVPTVAAPRVLAGDVIAMARDTQRQRAADGLVTHGDETTTQRDPDALSDDDRARASHSAPSRVTTDTPAPAAPGTSRARHVAEPPSVDDDASAQIADDTSRA